MAVRRTVDPTFRPAPTPNVRPITDCAVCGGPVRGQKVRGSQPALPFCGGCKRSSPHLVKKWTERYLRDHPEARIEFHANRLFTYEGRQYRFDVVGTTPDRDLGWRVVDVKTGTVIFAGFATSDEAREYVKMAVRKGRPLWKEAS